MAYDEPPRNPPPNRSDGWSDPAADRDVRRGRHRARHADAAPDAYDDTRREGPYGFAYGDGVSAQRSRPAVARPGSSRPGAAPNGARPPDTEITSLDLGLDRFRTTGSRAAGRAANAAAPSSAALPAAGSGGGASKAGSGDASKAGSGGDASKVGRAGRDLPKAIGVGLLMAGIVLGSLFLWRPAFVAVLTVCACVGVWEMVHAFAARAQPPLVPLIGGCLVMAPLAYIGGVQSLVLGLLVTILAVIVWRLSSGPTGFARDISAATLIAVYVPFLLFFGVLLARPDNGDLRVLCILAMVVLSDTGGYAVGVFLGKHPMAPSISPKKSWEGLAGSLVATGVSGAFLIHYLLHQPYWQGAIIGVAVSAAAVLGDLAESMLKRDLGIKDMSNLLPGHGGLMDRLDSVVFAAPTAFVLLAVFAPGAT